MTITCNSIMKKNYTIPQTETMTLLIGEGLMVVNTTSHSELGGAPGRISSDEVGPAGL